MYIHTQAYYQKHKINDVANSNFTYYRFILIFSLSTFVNSFSNGEKPGPHYLSMFVCWIHPQCNQSLITTALWVDILLTSLCLQHLCLAAAPPWCGCYRSLHGLTHHTLLPPPTPYKRLSHSSWVPSPCTGSLAPTLQYGYLLFLSFIYWL